MTAAATQGAPTPLYARTSARPPRVVLLAPRVAPRWIESWIALAAESGDLDVRVLRVEPLSCRRRSLPLELLLFLRAERWLVGWYLRILRRESRSPLAPVSLACRDEDVHRVKEGDVTALEAALQRLEPDVILIAGQPEWARRIERHARHGVWTLGGDLLDPLRAGVGLIAPIVEKHSAYPIGLALAQDDGLARELASGWGATRAVSFNQHRDQAFMKLPAMLSRALRRRIAEDCAPGTGGELRLSPARASLPFASGTRAFAIGVGLLAQSRSRRRRNDLPWFVTVRQDAAPLDPQAPGMGAVRNLVAPGLDYWADPFPVVVDGRRLIFVEEYVDRDRKGVIVCLELHADGTALRLGVVLDEARHLSYPRVFRWQDRWYMTVESCEAGRVSLYTPRDFPHGWERATDIVSGRVCVDPTLHHHQGHWYLFGNISESGASPSDELFLFVAEDLHGPFRPHPANPIVTDVRCARPAGSVFEHGGRLFRPSQCCAPLYGTAVVFNEILELTPDAYAERQVSRLDARWAEDLDGCHTYNRCDDLEVLDAHGRPSSQGRVEVTHPVGGRRSGDARLSSPMQWLFAASMWPWCL